LKVTNLSGRINVSAKADSIKNRQKADIRTVFLLGKSTYTDTGVITYQKSGPTIPASRQNTVSGNNETII
jgi:hypothetical protein